MNDPNHPNPLEQELRQFQPRAIFPDVAERLGNSLTSSNSHPPYPIPHTPSPTSDRCLLTALSLGTLAACVILTLTVSDFLHAPPTVSSRVARQPGGQPESLADYRQALAQLDPNADLFHRPH